ncbi:hypothetical protein VIBHAR_06430 [Vibrio campbellii ATCC BAA-1116]|uniref:Uncharacterized protein n=1 Tax=Vibrio campbellii (strain ATCC BAA-1116) TaxID=2902295 RepID=A7N8A1_VIBC1|nr:hypothetical protein VIBHAR_06430 [Vibrio campbellii ATCC BAA-1116]
MLSLIAFECIFKLTALARQQASLKSSLRHRLWTYPRY